LTLLPDSDISCLTWRVLAHTGNSSGTSRGRTHGYFRRSTCRLPCSHLEGEMRVRQSGAVNLAVMEKPRALVGGQTSGGTLMLNKRRRWPIRASVALIALLVSAAAGCLVGTGNSNSGGGGTAPGPETTTGCCANGVPSGYVEVDSTWSPTQCGNPTDSSVKNFCTYQNYSERPKGTVMEICNDQSVPAGWHQTGTSWSPTKCGSPATNTPNVMTIVKD
jgi:hypothetical protein